TLRTFSKVYGLAGVRIGYGFAHEDLIRNLLKVKLPFEPGTLAQAAGMAALNDKEWLHRTLELNARGLALFSKVLPRRGFTVVPSEANCMMVVMESAEAAANLHQSLLRRGVVLRPLASFGLPHCVRISTGSDADNQFLIDELASWAANSSLRIPAPQP